MPDLLRDLPAEHEALLTRDCECCVSRDYINGRYPCVHAHYDDGRRLLTLEEALADIRARGWTVAVHNDYRQYDGPCTFWLFTHVESGRFVKGEGATDAEALARVLIELEARRG